MTDSKKAQKPEKQNRKCLRCGKIFMSQNRFNRLCESCRHYDGI